jgi:hypothetical protein
VAAQRPPIPQQLRRDVLVEASHRCAICGSTPIEIAHIDPWSKVKEHKFENLIALCPNCHTLHHKGEIDRLSLLQYKRQLWISTRPLNAPAPPTASRLQQQIQAQAQAALNAAIDRAQATNEPAVPEGHRIELQRVAAGMERYLELERPVRYHPPGGDGSRAVANAFRTHFPDLALLLDEWTDAVQRIETSRTDMRDRLGAEMHERGDKPSGPLHAVIADALEQDRIEKLTWSAFKGALWMSGFVVVGIRDSDIEALKRPLNELIARAQGTTEALLLRADREALEFRREEIRDHLELIRAKHVIRGRCELCS